MHLRTPLLSFLSLLSFITPSTSYVIRTYEGEHCTGSTQKVNVWDNSCAGWPNNFRSFEILVYGGRRQKAAFYNVDGYCDALDGPWSDWWADGGDGFFQKGKCITLGFLVGAAGSRWA